MLLFGLLVLNVQFHILSRCGPVILRSGFSLNVNTTAYICQINLTLFPVNVSNVKRTFICVLFNGGKIM